MCSESDGNIEMTDVVGGVEAGGTKFVCAVGTGPDDIRAIERIPTTTPGETMERVVEFFRSQGTLQIQAVGVGSFGPLDLNPRSSSFGCIASTPKPDWSNADIAGPIRQALDVPVAFDTDVNAAALGEWHWGAARGLECFIYLTVGTGIGGGGMINGGLMHGLVHPEMGHVRIPHDRSVDPYPGYCPFHADCFEGLASGPAMADRWGKPPEQLSEDHPAWDLEAHYVALALVNYLCTLSPQRIVVGGGVMRQSRLYSLIRTKVLTNLNQYIRATDITESIEEFIVPPQLEQRAGVLGAIALGYRLLSS